MKNKKIIISILASLILAFCLVNVGWYVIRDSKYSKYSESMSKTALSTFLSPNYAENDADGFSYGVSYPDYLSFTGNLSVASPGEDEDDPYNDALIIWPLSDGGYEYGAVLYIDNIQYQIYIDKNGNAINDEDKDIVSRRSQTITTLLEKANAKWDLEQ